MAHFGAIAVASVLLKTEIEPIETYLTFSPPLIINITTLCVFGGISQMKEQQRQTVENKIKKFWKEKGNTVKVLRFIFVILQFLEFHFGIKLWFTAHFILLTTPKLLKEQIQQYLTGLLIIFQGSSIITSSESLGESIMKPQSLAGNGIFLSCLTLQFVINKKVMPIPQKQSRSKSYIDEFEPNVIDPAKRENKMTKQKLDHECLHKVNQLVSLFTASIIPNPSIMLLSMCVPMFSCMRHWNTNVFSGPIFVPFLYMGILIWSYASTNIPSDAYKWNIGGVSVALLMSINTVHPTDFYFEKIVEPLKPYLNQNFKIVLLYMLMSWLFFVLLITN